MKLFHFIFFIPLISMGSAHADYLSLEDLIKNKNIIEFNKLLNEEYKPTNLSEEIQYNYLK